MTRTVRKRRPLTEPQDEKAETAQRPRLKDEDEDASDKRRNRHLDGKQNEEKRAKKKCQIK